MGTRASSGCRSVSWLLLWLTLSAIALAQSPERHVYYLGHIGEEPIQLELELLQDGDGSSIVGWYYHQQVGEPISLEGFLGQAGDLVLHEPTGAGESAGRFTAKVPWSANEYLTRIEGVFREGRVELPFTLSRAAEYATFDLSQGNIRVRSTFPVFMQPQTRIFNATVTRAATSSLFESFEEAHAEGSWAQVVALGRPAPGVLDQHVHHRIVGAIVGAGGDLGKLPRAGKSAR